MQVEVMQSPLSCILYILGCNALQAFKNFSDEMSRILDIVGCYAVFRPEVGFTVKKQVHLSQLPKLWMVLFPALQSDAVFCL